MGLINPLFGYIAAGALVVGAIGGWKVRDWQCDAAYAKALEKSEAQRREMQETINELSASYQAEQDKAYGLVAGKTQTIREIYKTLPAVPIDCAPNTTVVGMLEGSVRDANAAASGKPGE